jgi:uncharacterized protein
MASILHDDGPGPLMSSYSTLPAIVRRRSSIHGFGVYAVEPIAKNRRIIDYAGELIPRAEWMARGERYRSRGRIWIFVVNRRWARDGSVGGNLARYLNHSCRPNCRWQVAGRTIWIRAARAIAPGEELTYDYATAGDHDIMCRCRTGCRTVL